MNKYSFKNFCLSRLAGYYTITDDGAYVFRETVGQSMHEKPVDVYHYRLAKLAKELYDQQNAHV